MAGYESAANALAAQKAAANDSQNSSLFQALMGHQAAARQQQVQGQQHLEAQAQASQLKGTEDQAKIERDMATLGQLKEQGYGGRSMKAGELSVAEQTPNVMGQVRRDNLNRMLVKDVSGDYEKKTTGLKSSMQAAQAIQNALDSGDIQTLGQIKANLPRLEGERFKPTDAERKLMLQPSAQGSLERLSNYFKGDNAALSDTQKAAIKNIISQKMSNAQKDMDASRAEVGQRWKHRISGLDPMERQDLDASLGSSTADVMKQTRGGKSPALHPAEEAEFMNEAKKGK